MPLINELSLMSKLTVVFCTMQSKRRLGIIERVNPDGLTAICKAMFKKETDITVFAGMKVGYGPHLCRHLI